MTAEEFGKGFWLEKSIIENVFNPDNGQLVSQLIAELNSMPMNIFKKKLSMIDSDKYNESPWYVAMISGVEYNSKSKTIDP